MRVRVGVKGSVKSFDGCVLEVGLGLRVQNRLAFPTSDSICCFEFLADQGTCIHRVVVRVRLRLSFSVLALGLGLELGLGLGLQCLHAQGDGGDGGDASDDGGVR